MSDNSLIKVYFDTYGCAKNEVDSQNMGLRLAEAGYLIVDEITDAQAIIVNTCSFIQEATEESIDAILDIAQLDGVASDEVKIIVSGCLPARYGEDLNEELDEVTSFVPCSKEDDIVAVLDGLFPHRISEGNASAPAFSISEYVKISDGCDRFCSYCTIPNIRGRYHSFTYEDIERTVQTKVDSGVREIVLIAQDTGRWGNDFTEKDSLSHLLDRLACAYPQTWFRVMYIQPEGITDELLNTIAAHSNVCSYLDIPLQHVDSGILKAMNRSGSRAEFDALIKHIYEILPDVTLRTTLIAGFPGETEDQFQDLVDFVSECDFDYIGVFPYSQEEGTRAAELQGQIPDDIKLERAQIIRDMADSVCIPRVAERIDYTQEVLVLGSEIDGQIFGRLKSQAPDVDGVCYLDAGEPGSFVKARIIDSLAYELEGEVL